MPSKLSIYNAALLALGERKLRTLSDNVTMRRRLDSAWDDDLVETCLAQGLWNFATNSIELTYSPSVEPAFAYQRAFDKPTDWVRTVLVAYDESFTQHLMEYTDEGDYWYANLDTIYVRYVSSGTTFGFDYAKWPQNFSKYVSAALAAKVARATTGSDSDVEKFERTERRMMIKARSSDAMDEPTKFPPKGSWLRARRTNSFYDRER
jgi:hypothetical protein